MATATFSVTIGQEKFRGTLSVFKLAEWHEWGKLGATGERYKGLFGAGFQDGFTLGLQVSAGPREKYIECLERRKFSPKEIVAIADKEMEEMGTSKDIRMSLLMAAALRRACDF